MFAYLKEETISRFLEIPDVLEVNQIIFQCISYLGSFPFEQNAPVILGFNELLIVVVILTERYQRVLKKGSRDRTKLLFKSLAVFDRKSSNAEHENQGTEDQEGAIRNHGGFAIDEAANDEEEFEDDDELAMAALESLDAIQAFKQGDAPIQQSSIPTDNLRKVIMLLLLISPLHPQESLSKHSASLFGERLKGLRRTADNILSAFVDVEKSPGVKIHHFNNAIPNSLPFLFNGFNALFEHFLFSKNFNLSKREDSEATTSAPLPPPEVEQPLLQEEGEILDLNVLCQLSFFIPGSSLFRRLRLLYSGGEAGFSMGSFETQVFNWRAPTILLVSGMRISDPPTGGQEKGFAERLPLKRFPDSSKTSRVVFGAYISQPWRQTHKECFGDSDTLLFQLEPTHEVFKASSVNRDYVSFTKPPTTQAGIAFGNPPPKPKPTPGTSNHAILGPVSLQLDSSFEFGVFTHNYTSGGGAFHNSTSRKRDWQDRFEIESLEVWGCGGDEEADQQRQRWAWEEREAEARRRVNLGTGDVEADRALLEMAGIIGGNRSGGSMS